MNQRLLSGEPTTFKKLYPQVKSLRLTGQEHGDFPEMSFITYKSRGLINCSESSIPALLHCSNPRCQQGGHDLQFLIGSAIRSRETRLTETLYCNGHEGTPKGRKIGDSCGNYIELEIAIEYVQE
ncbi:MAG TPA: hypothetical protein DEP04_00885 [Dehalococcoidia bacterium]|jgi:hypothetical protein|uniref:hypothetical protein n=1 Tax=unclassified Ketobacter TaxID=2639109 RepID=UPI000ED3B6EF|nr:MULTISPECIES: hypothetical protein [unclassified Ketobacter]HCE75156.1 hypothetical protein [Dehalococcoidia bacterium]